MAYGCAGCIGLGTNGRPGIVSYGSGGTRRGRLPLAGGADDGGSDAGGGASDVGGGGGGASLVGGASWVCVTVCGASVMVWVTGGCSCSGGGASDPSEGGASGGGCSALLGAVVVT